MGGIICINNNMPPPVDKGLTHLPKSRVGACTPLPPTSGNLGLKVALKSTCPDFLCFLKSFLRAIEQRYLSLALTSQLFEVFADLGICFSFLIKVIQQMFLIMSGRNDAILPNFDDNIIHES